MLKPAPLPNADERAALLSLLRSISEELHLIACEVVRLGEALSGASGAGEMHKLMRELQSFDLISQHMIAQARLLSGVERNLSENDGKHMNSLIQAVPFHKVRQRLYAAFGGEDGEAGQPQTGSDDMDWFA